MIAVRVAFIAMAFAFFQTVSLQAQSLQLPPEVTPALRAACEQDVRRLCISENSTVASVRSCVVRRYVELSSRCKVQIAFAGLTPSGR